MVSGGGDKRRLIEVVASGITREFTDRGQLLEAGWAAFRHLMVPKDAGPVEVNEIKLAFMAGAEHCFSSIMNVLDPGEEPTAADMRRMDLIHAEVEKWRAVLDRVHPNQGSA